LFGACLANTIWAFCTSAIDAHLTDNISGVRLLLAFLAGLVSCQVGLTNLTVLSVDTGVLQRERFKGMVASSLGARFAAVSNAH
jgi:hypothetical protein